MGKYYFYEKSDSSKEKLITIKSSYKKILGLNKLDKQFKYI